MDEVTDVMLLQQYAREGSEAAFSELAARHAGWVYATAARVVRDRHLAEDVTQAVFLVLAERAGELTGQSLGPWLFRVTRYSCVRALRDKGRRARREREAGTMATQLSDAAAEDAWGHVAPLLDEMVYRLAPAARNAILLRFYQQKTLAEVGRSLGVSEDAARKRVGKAVEQLRKMFDRRGVAVSAALLAATLTAGMSAPAPASLVASCGVAATANTAANASAISKGAIAMMIGHQVKTAALVVLLASIPATAGFVAWSHASAAGRRAGPADGATAMAKSAPPAAAPATQPGSDAERRRATQQMVICQSHLHAIGQGLLHWADRHQGKYPPDLGSLIRDRADNFSIDTFVCPATATKAPKGLTRDQQADWVNAHSDYVYVGAGLDSQKVDPDDVLAYEKSDDHARPKVMNVLGGDGHTVAMTVAQFEKLIAQAKARQAPTTRP